MWFKWVVHALVKIGFNAHCSLVCNNCSTVLTAVPLCLGCMEAKTLFIFLLFNENLFSFMTDYIFLVSLFELNVGAILLTPTQINQKQHQHLYIFLSLSLSLPFQNVRPTKENPGFREIEAWGGLSLNVCKFTMSSCILQSNKTPN